MNLRPARDRIASITRLIPAWAWVTAILLVTLLVTGGLAAYKWDWLQTAGSDIEESNSTTFRNVGLLIGAILAGILAIWRSAVADRQANATNRQADVAQAQASTAQESLRHDRYQRGTAMLGGELLPVRLAGISALKRLAADYPGEYHIQIMDVFCGFVRDPTGLAETSSRHRGEGDEQTRRLREDVQAILGMIGYRSKDMKALEKQSGFRIDLRGADLRDANLDEASLSGAMLVEAKLSRARLQRADLSKADMRFADLSCSTEFTINKTFLDGANLDDVKLMYANLSGSRFQGARLSRAQLLEADMSNTFLYRACLIDADLNLTDFSEAILNEADISGARLVKGHVLGSWLTAEDKDPTTKLTQQQLDQACADPGNPPQLNEVLDCETGKPLKWTRDCT